MRKIFCKKTSCNFGKSWGDWLVVKIRDIFMKKFFIFNCCLKKVPECWIRLWFYYIIWMSWKNPAIKNVVKYLAFKAFFLSSCYCGHGCENFILILIFLIFVYFRNDGQKFVETDFCFKKVNKRKDNWEKSNFMILMKNLLIRFCNNHNPFSSSF